MVCPDDWEPRQPIDFIKVQVEDYSIPWSDATSIQSTSADYSGQPCSRTAIAGIAIAGCAMAGVDTYENSPVNSLFPGFVPATAGTVTKA